MTRTDYVYYELSGAVLDEIGLPHLPFPVRPQEAWRIFQGRHVEFPLLLDELDRFIDDDPEAGEPYRTTLAVLSYVLAIRAGSSGDIEEANRLFALGLKHRPEHVLLRIHHAFSLQLLGRYDEATAEYEALLAEPRTRDDPIIRLLAARALGDSGDADAACRLLLDGPAALVGDPVFRRLVSGYAEQAGWPPLEWIASGGVAGAHTERASPDGGAAFAVGGADIATPAGRFCRQCGKPLRAGLSFCTACGHEAGT